MDELKFYQNVTMDYEEWNACFFMVILYLLKLLKVTFLKKL